MRLRKKINIKNSFVAKQALHKMAVISLLVLVAPISIAMAKDTATETKVAEIKLNTNSSQLVSIESSAPVIVPGDSLAQAEIKRIEEEKKKEAALAAEKAASAQRVILTREYRVTATPDPASFDSIYAGAESAFGVDARILKAVHYVETGMSGSTAKSSYAGAVGPMQFLPSTFRAYAYDGNGDGVKDITNVYDAIYSAARYLKACGYPDVRQALYGYNHSDSYVNKVLGVARSLGFPQ